MRSVTPTTLSRQLAGLSLAALCAAVPTSDGSVTVSAPTAGTVASRPIGNVLIVLADDLGVDQLAAYGVGTDLPITPNLDALALSGVVFRNAWSNPNCSPTRASILTGRYAFRNGIGDIVETGPYVLPPSELLLPEVVAAASKRFSSALIGKWHLGATAADGDLTPNAHGFDHFEGTFASLEPVPTSYTNWPLVLNGVAATQTQHATVYNTNAAVNWIQSAPEPWFCVVAYHLPHAPYHAPPAGTYSEDLTGLTPIASPRPFYKAMVESLDHHVGELLTRISGELARTTVIFAGDNGTPGNVTVAPFDATHAKGTPYQGGVQVPLIVSGPLVKLPGRDEAALVQLVDVFQTVADIAGVDPKTLSPAGAIDSVSLVPYLVNPGRAPLRNWAYTETFRPNGALPTATTSSTRVIRGTQYKLICRNGPDEFYDLLADPFESNDLIATSAMGPAELAVKNAFDNIITTLLATP